MTSEQFLQEVLNSQQCPENFENIYRDFQRYQKLVMDTLLEFHRVCEKNNIPYQLAYGSLLGAIRDDGQIPWDYDVDIFVPYEKKNELIATLKRDLNDDFYFYCPEVDPKCRHFIMRLTPNGYRSEVLHVDIFYIIGAPDLAEKNQKFGQSVRKVFRQRYNKLVNIREASMGGKKTCIHMLLNRIKVLCISRQHIDEKWNSLCEAYKLSESKYCTSADDIAGKNIYETEELWDTMLYQVTAGTFRITKNYSQVLNTLYHDYMQIPSLNSRINEILSSYKRLRYYETL